MNQSIMDAIVRLSCIVNQAVFRSIERSDYAISSNCSLVDYMSIWREAMSYLFQLENQCIDQMNKELNCFLAKHTVLCNEGVTLVCNTEISIIDSMGGCEDSDDLKISII